MTGATRDDGLDCDAVGLLHHRDAPPEFLSDRERAIARRATVVYVDHVFVGCSAGMGVVADCVLC